MRRLSLQPIRELDTERDPGHLDRAHPRSERNVAYIANLVALRAWYRHVRLARASDSLRVVVDAGIETLGVCIAERVKRLEAFLAERNESMPSLNLEPPDAEANRCPLQGAIADATDEDHVTWVQRLDAVSVQQGVGWLQSIANSVAG